MIKILLATPFLSQHYDIGLFWADALSQLGYDIALWDYRYSEPLNTQADVSIVLKGGFDPSSLPGKKICYWPDEFGRDPKAEQYLTGYDLVVTCVRPTPPDMVWLPTGWKPRLHYNSEIDARDRCAIFAGTATERKWPFLSALINRGVLKRIYGNNWDQFDIVTTPIYLHDLVFMLSRSWVGVNVHRGYVGLNRRFFEMGAAGVFATDNVPGVCEILGDLSEQLVFRTPDEAIAVVDKLLSLSKKSYLLLHDEIVERILPYTYKTVAKRLLEHV